MSQFTRRKLLVGAGGCLCVSVAPAVSGQQQTEQLWMDSSLLTDGSLVFLAENNQRIFGDSTVDSGTEVLFIVQTASGEDPPFLKRRWVSIDQGGEWSFEIDLGAYQPGTNFSVTAYTEGGSQIYRADGQLISYELHLTPGEFLVPDQESRGEFILIDSVRFPHGGFLQIEGPDGAVVTTTERFERGQYERIPISLASQVEIPATLTVALYAAENAPYTTLSGERVTRTATLTEPSQAVELFVIDGVDPFEIRTETGSEARLSVTIRNDGETAGTQPIELLLRGDVVAKQDVSLGIDESQQVQFTFTPEDVGAGESYPLKVRSKDDGGNAILTLTENTTQQDSTNTDGSNSDGENQDAQQENETEDDFDTRDTTPSGGSSTDGETDESTGGVENGGDRPQVEEQPQSDSETPLTDIASSPAIRRSAGYLAGISLFVLLAAYVRGKVPQGTIQTAGGITKRTGVKIAVLVGNALHVLGTTLIAAFRHAVGYLGYILFLRPLENS